MNREDVLGRIFVVSLICLPAVAMAAEIHVPADHQTIQAAIDAATDGDTIIVADGTYTGPGNRDIAFRGKAIHLRSENGPEKCIIDAGGTGKQPHRACVFTSGEDENSILDGFTITGGYATGKEWDDVSGGGVFCKDSSPTIINNIVVGNTASGHSKAYGGGIRCKCSSAVISHNVITGNAVSEAGQTYGSGICCWDGSPTIAHNILTDNTARGCWASALFLDHSSAIIAENTIASNDGRGICIRCAPSPSPITSYIIASNTITGNGGSGISITDCHQVDQIARNAITGNGGSGIWICESNVRDVTENMLENNDGGGLWIHQGSPTVWRNTIRGNSAQRGAGIRVSDGSPTIRDTIIADNEASDLGGAICTSSSDLLLSHVTITGNRAGLAGGGIYALIFGGARVSHSILWGNTAPRGPELCCRGFASVSVSYSDVEGGRASVRVRDDATLEWGEGNIDVDPYFGDARGGDYHLQSIGGRWDPAADHGNGAWVVDERHSPCIDAGDPRLSARHEPEDNGGRVNIGRYGSTAEASKAYAGHTHLLTLRSRPVSGVPISGTVCGVTDLARNVPPSAEIVVYGWQAHGLSFLWWEDETGNVLSHKGRLRIIVDRDTTATAVYGYVTDFYVNDSVPDGLTGIGDDDNPGTLRSHPAASIQSVLSRYPRTAVGCTVHVAPGTYAENVYVGREHPGLRLLGSGPSVTVIDGNQTGPCLETDFEGGAVSGFCLTNGSDYYAGYYAGGICCCGSIEISGNLISDNTGNGICCWDCSPAIRNNAIVRNEGWGVTIAGCDDMSCAPTLTGNTIAHNRATSGGAVCAGHRNHVTIANSILWDNTAGDGPEIAALRSTVSLSYTDMSGIDQIEGDDQGNILLGEHVISVDPCFADPENGDYHLRSAHGRWNPTANGASGGWVNDAVTSPCIDAGDPHADYAAEPMPNFGRVNMGAYGNTAEASMSGWNIAGDVTGDCTVDIADLIAVRDRHHRDPASGDNWKADVNNDGKINILDLLLVRNRIGMGCAP